MKFIALLGILFAPGFAADLLIHNVNIVDVSTGNVLPRRSVLIQGSRIQNIAATIHPPRPAEIVEGHGKYLIPGLWDMHVHLWYTENEFPMYLAWGVTGVRDMGSNLAQVKRWRNEVRSGALLGPHIETCGPVVDGFPSEDAKLPVVMVRSPAEARSMYDHLEQDLHVDFIEVLSRLPRDAYFALLDRARKWGLPVAGPVPDTVTVEEAVTSRQSSIEHLSNMLLACSNDEHKLLGPRANAIERKDANSVLTLDERALAGFDVKKADALIEHMARYTSYQTPTLMKLRRMTYTDADEAARDPHLKYIPAAIRKTWNDPREDRKKQPEAALTLLEQEYEKDCYLLDRMQRGGVPIMAGTDTGQPYTFPGYDLHRELQLLVKAGLTPLQALRSATIVPAQYLDSDESLGSVASGKVADLVLLEADPLKDIRNTQKISAVVVGGKYLSKAKLDSMLGHHRLP